MYHLIAVQRFLQINPFGNINMTNTTNQRHNCETIQSRAKTRQASSKPFDLVSPFTDLWSSCNNMHHQGNIYKFETFTWWDKNLYCPPSKHIQKKKVKDENKCLLGRNTSHSTGRISAQHYLSIFFLNVVPCGAKAAPGFLVE